MVIPPVDERDLDRRLLQRCSGRQTAEPSADDHHPGARHRARTYEDDHAAQPCRKGEHGRDHDGQNERENDGSDRAQCVFVIERLAHRDDGGGDRPHHDPEPDEPAQERDDPDAGQQSGRLREAHRAEQLTDIGLRVPAGQHLGADDPHEAGKQRPRDERPDRVRNHARQPAVPDERDAARDARQHDHGRRLARGRRIVLDFLERRDLQT